MRLTVRLLGLDLLDIDLTTDQAIEDDDPERDLSGGTTSAMPLGFTASHGDQRWEPSPELE